MAKNTDEKLNIQEAITAFVKDDISKAGINLFTVLGYDTSLQAPLDDKTYEEFKGNYIENSPNAERFSEDKAMTNEWKSIDILFQLTDNSFSGQLQLFDSKLDPLNPQSYLGFAIELHGNEYTKSQIANITREVNKLFPIPIFIVYKYGEYLTLAIINRRVNKRDNDKDVLEKVTLIKDIIFAKPHRAHIEILYDMSLKQLEAQIKFSVTNFSSLHKAWSEVLDTQTLNKRFYTELSNWYFWAIKTVVYPGYEMEAEKNSLFTKEDKLREHNTKNLIRLLTRLLFVWFIKEKGLIPEELFDEQVINNLITSFEPEKYYSSDAMNIENKSIYYKAILQNLFFASLNAEHGKRAFRLDGQNQNATSLMRYQRFHKNPHGFVELIESKVPFMNGGLFECLDSQDDERKGRKGGALVNYEDGFSDREDNKLFVPDYVFFGKNIKVDLSTEYDDKKKKDVIVNGIIHILQKYKFTIAENTPVEEDIALDPELLGRVFENLLASYNPETKTNARKQTGSFYTPRPIVEYMVDESLKAYLKTRIKKSAISTGSLEEATIALEKNGGTLDSKLDNLVAYNELEPEFTEDECFQILQYIDECRILDPACGSGAFPMGILQKMVYLIHKLDPQNDSWKQIQIQKISNDPKLTPKEKNGLQREILSVFDDNELDYARKLYLIENCIHGIDIQPIATQISRLRFFISLIVDQKVDSTKPNFGVRPLPNLENRFVTANSLIGLDEETATLFDKDIEPLMERLQKVRHNLFNAKTPEYKFDLRQEDKAIRMELEAELVRNGFGQKNAKLLSTWDPYDKNKTADFFDAEWMFGIKDGFDIVIGNPPYVNINTMSQMHEVFKQIYPEIHTGYNDLMYYFICQGIRLLSYNGIQTFITSNYFLGNDYAKKLRLFLNDKLEKVINFHNATVFESASVHTAISFTKKKTGTDKIKFYTYKKDFLNTLELNDDYEYCELERKKLSDTWIVSNVQSFKIIEKMKKNSVLLGSISEIAKGAETGKNGIFSVPKAIIEANNIELEIVRQCIKNSHIQRYVINKIDLWLIYCDNDFSKTKYPNAYAYLEKFKNELLERRGPKTGEYEWWRLHRPSDKIIHDAKEKLVVPYRADHNRFAYDNEQCFNDGGDIRAIVIKKYSGYSIKFILGLLNSTLLDWFYGFIGKPKGNAREYFNKPLAEIPIPTTTAEQQKPIIDLVDKILAAKKADTTSDTSELEHEIDELVYKLYGLTDEEIAVVEGR